MKRRTFLKAASVCAPALLIPNINFGQYRIFGDDRKYSLRTIDLVRESIVVDMLNQFAWNQFSDPPVLERWLNHPETFTAEDARQFIDSGVNAFALGHAKVTRLESLNYFTQWNKFLSTNAAWLKRIDKADDLINVNTNGKTGVILTFQDSKHFDSIEDVNTFYDMGQRLSQLTYNYANKIGSGGFDNEDHGLTDFGKRVVAQMNAVGMMVDVSHCSDRTTLDGIEVSSKPVIITHANCRSLNPGHPRAKTDEMIKKMADKGGIMGIAEIRFMVKDKEPVTVEDFLDHYDHVIQLVGPDHIGIGTDFDLETEDNPRYLEKRKLMFADIDGERAKKYRMHTDDQYRVGIDTIDHPRKIYDITEGFIRRNYSDENIRLILGGNFLRVAKTIWK